MKDLTKVEETILLSIFRMEEDAYGVSIKRQIRKVTGRDYLYSTLYTALDQLTRKDYIKKYWGDPSPRRGGKRKLFFRLTRNGLNALEDAFRKHQSVWSGISKDSFRKGYSK